MNQEIGSMIGTRFHHPKKQVPEIDPEKDTNLDIKDVFIHLLFILNFKFKVKFRRKVSGFFLRKSSVDVMMLMVVMLM